jgi:hypothetical protein
MMMRKEDGKGVEIYLRDHYKSYRYYTNIIYIMLVVDLEIYSQLHMNNQVGEDLPIVDCNPLTILLQTSRNPKYIWRKT